MTPLASVFSMLDTLKRNLSLRGMEGTIERTGQNLEQFGKLQEAAMSGDKAAGQAVTDKMLEQVLNFSPLGITLYHGGPQAIQKVMPELLGKTGQMQGPGFYMSDRLNVPKMFATRMSSKGEPGVISAFDFPDELYNRVLPLTEMPLTTTPLAGTKALRHLLTENLDTASPIKKSLVAGLKDARSMGSLETADDLLTGELVNWSLNNALGKTRAAASMAGSGITGKSWDYTAEHPDIASVIFQRYLDELRPVGNVQVTGPEQEYAQRLLEQVLSKGGTK